MSESLSSATRSRWDLGAIFGPCTEQEAEAAADAAMEAIGYGVCVSISRFKDVEEETGAEQPAAQLPPPSVPHDFISRGLGGATVTTKDLPSRPAKNLAGILASACAMVGFVVLALAINTWVDWFYVGFTMGGVSVTIVLAMAGRLARWPA